MTITDEMVEAACVAYAGGTLEYLGPTATRRLRRDMRRALYATESLRPKMVEVGQLRVHNEAGENTRKLFDYDLTPGFALGLHKLYAVGIPDP